MINSLCAPLGCEEFNSTSQKQFKFILEVFNYFRSVRNSSFPELYPSGSRKRSRLG